MSHKITSKQRPGQGSNLLQAIPKKPSSSHPGWRCAPTRRHPTAHGPHKVPLEPTHALLVYLCTRAPMRPSQTPQPPTMNTKTTAASCPRESGASGSHQWAMVNGEWSMVHGASAIVHRPSSMGKHRVPVSRKRGRGAPALLLPVCSLLHYCCRWEVLPVLT